MNSYICLILMKNMSLSSVEDEDVRKFNRFSVSLLRHTVANAILQLVEHVEMRISEELAGTQGAIVYEGWSYNSVHYIGEFGFYTTNIYVRKGSTKRTQKVVRKTLIALYPMGNSMKKVNAEMKLKLPLSMRRLI